jgi:Tol biopolymer transport system component
MEKLEPRLLLSGAEIQGSVWTDLNGNGTRDDGEGPLPGWTVYLDVDGDGSFGGNEPSQVTDDNGHFIFADLSPGTYAVREVHQTQWLQTYPAHVTIQNGEFESGDFSGWNAAGVASVQGASYGTPPSVGGYQALLVNGSEAISAAEIEGHLGLASGTLGSLGNGTAREGSVLWQTITVEAGSTLTFDWNFLTDESLPSGNHNDFAFVSITPAGLGVTELADTGYQAFADSLTDFRSETGYSQFQYTFATTGTYVVGVGVVDAGDTKVDSAVLVDGFHVASNDAHVVTLAGEEAVTGQDFGNQFQSGRIEGTLWNDLDGDGTRDGSEPVLPGWTVFLDADSDGQPGPSEVSTTTDSGGQYAFEDLVYGSYQVVAVQPAGWVRTAPHVSWAVDMRVSVAANGAEGNSPSQAPSISSDGRYVAFTSVAGNLVAGDTNGTSDVFVYDRQTGEVQRVSVAGDSTEGNADSYGPSISGDGRYVAFYSNASNLVAGDTNGTWDVFVYDRQAGSTERVSVAAGGTEGNGQSDSPSISGDGRFVAFVSGASNLVAGDTNGADDVFVYDRQTGAIQRLSVADGGDEGDNDSYYPSISGDGRFVAFQSYASNLVAGDTNGREDIFVYDRQAQSIQRVSVAYNGTEGNADAYSCFISDDGQLVAFTSSASNLVTGDTNGFDDVFVYDRQTQSIQRISVAGDGTEGNVSSYDPSISSDGRFVAFQSYASNLVAGDANGRSDVFVYDRQTGSVQRVSVAAGGAEANADSYYSSISRDGHSVVFQSDASNLVSGDTNGCTDIFTSTLRYGQVVSLAPGQTLTGIDLGLREIPGSIEGVLWSDLDGDGIRDSGEPALAGWTVWLDGTGNDQSQVTDATGHYVFADLAPGTYTLSEVAQSGWLQTCPANNAVYTVVLASGQVVTDRDFGNHALPVRIEGSLWNDLNGDGVHDGGEPVLTGWAVFLDADGDGLPGPSEVLTTTDGNGHYAFENLVYGSYRVVTAQPAGWVRTAPAESWGVNQRVSVTEDGAEGNADSYGPSTSGDGRFVAFYSSASNLVAGDTNSASDVFVYDRQSGSVQRISVADGGAEGNAYSFSPSISDDGRFVAFTSNASNLVAGDTNGHEDIFVYDRQTQSIQRVSVADGGAEGNDYSFDPSISGDGRFVAFYSYASNLVAGDTNNCNDVFVFDRQSGSVQRVSVADGGAEGNAYSFSPSISDDGRFVAFTSYASNLVTGDTNSMQDIFVYDRQTGSIHRASVANGGTESNDSSDSASISGDGRFVAFTSNASNLVTGDANGTSDVFVYDCQTGSIQRASAATGGAEGNGYSDGASISGDGRFVVFYSSASNLVAGDTNGRADIFVYDRQADTLRRVSVATDGAEADYDSYSPSISGDGRVVTFLSNASNLVAGDLSGFYDIFTGTLLPGQPVSLAPGQTLTGVDLDLHQEGCCWTGSESDQWNLSGNWSDDSVPDAATSIQFYTTPPANQPDLYQDQAVLSLDILTPGWTVDLNGQTLSIGTGGLNFAGGTTPTSKIDLGNGNLIVGYSGASPLATIEGWVKAGGGTKSDGAHYDWNGTGGITTSSIVGDDKQYKALGIRDNGFALENRPAMTLVDGVPVPANSVVVKYTWIGDMDLDGKVTVNDYLEWLNYYRFQPAPENISWMTGDFNYDGQINVNDYLMLLIGYRFQSGQLSSGVTLQSLAPAASAGTTTTTAPTASTIETPATPAPAAQALTLVDLLRQAGGTQALTDDAGEPTLSETGSGNGGALVDLAVRPAADGATDPAAVMAIR